MNDKSIVKDLADWTGKWGKMHCEQHPRRPTGMETGVQNIQYLFMGGKKPQTPSFESIK